MAESQSGLVSFRFTICVVEIGVDGSIVVLAIAEHVACWDPIAVEIFALRTDYHSGTYTIFIYDRTFLSGR